ncbi:MAG: YciI family protein [Pseudomonadota bacterium]
MIYAVLFEDNEDAAHMRSQHMAEHLAFLERNQAAISAAGPMLDAETSSPAGGLWLVNADTVDDARRLVENDPFWPTGLRKAVRILEWKQVFSGGQRL